MLKSKTFFVSIIICFLLYPLSFLIIIIANQMIIVSIHKENNEQEKVCVVKNVSVHKFAKIFYKPLVVIIPNLRFAELDELANLGLSFTKITLKSERVVRKNYIRAKKPRNWCVAGVIINGI
ncbi:MAG: hypothetical protein GY839_05260, partial [candidate division Zixibacteria bacterium]|nr:hypothetical protein [candidate division Zixibacteria bacterium]